MRCIAVAQPALTPIAFAKIKRKDFGLPWPITVLQQMSVGFARSERASSMAARTARGSWPSCRPRPCGAAVRTTTASPGGYGRAESDQQRDSVRWRGASLSGRERDGRRRRAVRLGIGQQRDLDHDDAVAVRQSQQRDDGLDRQPLVRGGGQGVCARRPRDDALRQDARRLREHRRPGVGRHHNRRGRGAEGAVGRAPHLRGPRRARPRRRTASRSRSGSTPRTPTSRRSG